MLKKSTVSRQDLATKIIEFITNSNPHTLTVQLWRLPESGGYDELELNNPVIKAGGDNITINDIDDTTQAVNIEISTIASINYGVAECLITLKNGEAIKLVRR